MEKKDNVHDNEMVVPIKTIKEMAEKLSKGNEEAMASFEFILASLFPTAWENIKKYGTEQYMLGYEKGFEDARNEN